MNALTFAAMKKFCLVLTIFAVVSISVALAIPLIAQQQGQRGTATPPPTRAQLIAGQQGHGNGKLIVYSDMALFLRGSPEDCYLKNRFKPGDGVGWRITVVDGGTGEPEITADPVIHVTYNGQTIDVPTRYRGSVEPGGRGGGPLRQNQWTGKWDVPKDAVTGIAQYTITAKDKFGRTAEFKPFDNPASLLTIVQ
jgi:hypothetical protein